MKTVSDKLDLIVHNAYLACDLDAMSVAADLIEEEWGATVANVFRAMSLDDICENASLLYAPRVSADIANEIRCRKISGGRGIY